MITKTPQKPSESETQIAVVFCSANDCDLAFDEDQISALIQSSQKPRVTKKEFDSLRKDVSNLVLFGEILIEKLMSEKLLSSDETSFSFVLMELTLTGVSCSLNFPPDVFDKAKSDESLGTLFVHIISTIQDISEQFGRIIQKASGKTALDHHESVSQSLLMVHSWGEKRGEEDGD